MDNSSMLATFNQLAKRFAGTNLLWFFCNLPVVLIGYYLLNMNETGNNKLFILLAIACVGPVVFFPATSAMFAVLRKFIMGEDIPITQSYFKYYQENYLKSFVGSILPSVLWGILAYGYLSWKDIHPFYSLLMFVIGVVLFVFTTNFISTIVHMEVELIAAYKNAFIITIGAPLLSGLVGGISSVLIYLSMNVIPILVPLVAGSILAYISFFGYYKVILNIQYLSEIAEEENEVDLEGEVQ